MHGETSVIFFFTQAVTPGRTIFGRVFGDSGGSPTLRCVPNHRALRYLHTMRNASQRLTRWALAMQPFNFTIEHRPGVQNGNADGLSRQAWRDNNNAPHCCTAGEEGGSVGDSPLQQQGATPPSKSSCLPLSYDLTGGWKLEDEITDAGICLHQVDATRASHQWEDSRLRSRDVDYKRLSTYYFDSVSCDS